MIQRIFPSEELAPTHSTTVIRGLSIHLFSFNNEVGFSSQGRLLCLYDKQNNTWLHVDTEFLFSSSTRHLTRSLRSLVSYRVKHSKKKLHIYAPMFYSLLLWDCHQLCSLGLFFLPYWSIFLHHQPIIIFNVLFYSWDRKRFEFYLDLSFFHNVFQRP